MSETPKKQLTAMVSRDTISHAIAYLSDLAPDENGNYIRVTNTLGQNLAALDTAVANIPEQVDYSLTISAPQTPDPSYAAQYEFKQRGQTIGTINIPKDMVVSSGSVVDITYDEGHLYDGQTDVTEIIKGTGGTATESDAGKYIKLTIANKTNSTLYVKVSDLVDIYTAQQNASQVQLAIDANNVISATIVAGSIGATELDSTVNASLAKADTALQASDVASTYDASGTAPVNGVAVAAAIAAIPSVDISGKADKVANATEGNLAALDANGNLTDSGSKASDFAEADHTHDSLVNGDASLNLSQAGVATVTVAGAVPATTATGVITITAGTLSGTEPYGGQQFSIEIEDQVIEVPLTTSNNKWQGQSAGSVGDFVGTVDRPLTSGSSGALSLGKKPQQGFPMMQGIGYDIDNTDYEHPTLTVNPMYQSMGTTFTGTVTYSQTADPATDLVKTIATTDDVNTAITTAVNALDAEKTSTDGTNVQVKVTETNGKITAVNITKDTTYSKPEGGIPTADIADGAINAAKLGSLSQLILTDVATTGEYVGKKYRLTVLEGRLMIEECADPIPVFPKYALINLEHWGWDDSVDDFIDVNNQSIDRVLVGIAADDRTITVLRSDIDEKLHFIPCPAGKKVNWETLELEDDQYSTQPFVYTAIGDPDIDSEYPDDPPAYQNTNVLGIVLNTDLEDEDPYYGEYYEAEDDAYGCGAYLTYLDGESTPSFSPYFQYLTAAQAQELYSNFQFTSAYATVEMASATYDGGTDLSCEKFLIVVRSDGTNAILKKIKAPGKRNHLWWIACADSTSDWGHSSDEFRIGNSTTHDSFTLHIDPTTAAATPGPDGESNWPTITWVDGDSTPPNYPVHAAILTEQEAQDLINS